MKNFGIILEIGTGAMSSYNLESMKHLKKCFRQLLNVDIFFPVLMLKLNRGIFLKKIGKGHKTREKTV